MRIGITCYPTYGGSGAVATELGLELARRGHDVHFISYASPFRLRGFAERVEFETKVPARLADSPLTCVAEGAGRALDEMELLERATPVTAGGLGGLRRPAG